MIGYEGNKRPCNRFTGIKDGRFFGWVVIKDQKGNMEAETERIRRSQSCRDGRTFQSKETERIKARKTWHFK